MTNNNLAVVRETTAIATEDMFSDERVQMIRNQVAQGAPEGIFLAFLDIAKRRNLDPLSKQISLIKFGGQYTIITTIDGYRAIAEQTGQYAGSDAPVFTYNGEKTQAGKQAPDTCTVTVHKLINGQTYPFSAMVYFEEYNTGKNNWSSMPRTMLAKVAESHALRKAFPAVMSGMYEESEMDQAIEGTANVVISRARTAQVDDHGYSGPPDSGVYGAGQQQRPTASIAPPNGGSDWDAASKRFHAVLGKYGISEAEKRAFIRRGKVESGSARDMTAQQLRDAASFIDSKDDPKAFMTSLLPQEQPSPEQQQQPTEDEQAELEAINAAVGAEYDAQHPGHGDA